MNIKMNKEDFFKIQEQIRNENDTANLHISPFSEYEYWAFDKINFRFYWFVFDKESITKDSNEIDMYIIDISALSYAIYPLALKDYARTASNPSRIKFTEEYIQKFINEVDKEIISEAK